MLSNLGAAMFSITSASLLMENTTNDAMEEMENAKIRCWNKTQKNEMEIATSPSERWLMKAAEWNSELGSKYRTNRAIGRPRKRWEDVINEFLKQIEDETENLTESSRWTLRALHAHERRG